MSEVVLPPPADPAGPAVATTPAPAGPAPVARIDLDAKRKARREKRGPAPSIVFLGDSYDLPLGLDSEVIDLVAQVNAGDWSLVTKAIDLVIGSANLETMRAKAKAEGDVLELEDLVDVLEGALEIYGVTLPES